MFERFTQEARLAVVVAQEEARDLRAVRALRELAERLEVLQVGNARARGWSWQQIAQALGVTRQAVHKKHARSRKDV